MQCDLSIDAFLHMPEIAPLAETLSRRSLEVTWAAPIAVARSQHHSLEVIRSLLSHRDVLPLVSYWLA
jgi:hypothetical protein